MDKTHNISLGGFSFLIEDKAYQELSKYLNEVRKSLGNTSDTNEIIYDVEQRMAELLKTQMKGREVVVNQDVDYLISVLGRPEQYVDEEQTTETNFSKQQETTFTRINTHIRSRKLYRDMERKKLGGVLSGLSYYLNFDVAWLRIIYLVLLFFVQTSLIFNKLHYLSLASTSTFFGISGFWIMMYIVFWILVPPAETTAEKLEMQGKSVTIDTLSASKITKNANGRQLYRSREKAKLGGVLSGLSEYYQFDTTWIRILFIVLVLGLIPLISISSLLVIGYTILWIAIPKKPIFFDDEPNEVNKNQSNKSESEFEMKENETHYTTNQDFENQNFVEKKQTQKTENREGFWLFVRAVIKGVLYVIIGFVLLILLFNLLSLLLALFGIGIAGWGVGFSVLTLTDYLSFIVEGNWQLWIAYFSAASLFILPVLVISILCLKLFSKKGYQVSKAWILLNVFLFFFGVMGVITVSVDTFKHFQAYDSVEERIPVAVSDTISLSYEKQPHRYYKYDILNFGSPILKDDNEIIAKGDFVRFRIGETSEKEPYIILKKYSRGRNLSDAQAKASQVKYNLKIEANKVVLPEKYSLGENPKIRDQRIEVVLYLPQGKHITSSDEELSVLEFRSNKWINISRGGVAKMTENGLVKIENN
ncbi:hypothetical protein CGC56_01025 [Capnocytophaga canimorsus]|uniref:PspC domain-containing protein n=1 Tax=Capnocytophaga canimorsus TaxID=28188 RepID=A0A250G0P8_9FLAO|nr:PspC domain-containing protein [Capnocytophaga canimorsus]ATA90873.1 hypothetical protein CGC56_01025 [Capnocytophaga canimorsus]